MQAVALTETSPFTGKPTRISWTCRHCGHGFKTWTRRGLKITCPKCRRVQEGPAGIQALIDANAKLKGARGAAPAAVPQATTVRIVSAPNGGHKTPAQQPSAAVKPSAPAMPKADPKTPAPAATPPPTKKDPLSRILGF